MYIVWSGCTVLYELKTLQSVHGESDADAITVVKTVQWLIVCKTLLNKHVI